MHPTLSHTRLSLLGALLLSAGLITSVHAATHKAASAPATTSKAADDKAAVEVEGAGGTSQEEVATVDVLNEICPQVLGTNNDRNFKKGYANLITHMLPGIKQPVLAVQAMHSDPDYMKTYADARSKAQAAGNEDNREVCLEVLHYPADGSAAHPVKTTAKTKKQN